MSCDEVESQQEPMVEEWSWKTFQRVDAKLWRSAAKQPKNLLSWCIKINGGYLLHLQKAYTILLGRNAPKEGKSALKELKPAFFAQ